MLCYETLSFGKRLVFRYFFMLLTSNNITWNIPRLPFYTPGIFYGFEQSYFQILGKNFSLDTSHFSLVEGNSKIDEEIVNLTKRHFPSFELQLT